MYSHENFWNQIDAERLRRVKELSEIGRVFGTASEPDPEAVSSKATVVLCYAVWEGFYKECIDIYVSYLRSRGGKVRETDWMLLLGVIGRDLASLKDRNHSETARFDFVRALRGQIESEFDQIDSSQLKTQTNLNFQQLSYGYAILNFDLLALQKFRIRLDRELVGWRNSVAHGDTPDLSKLDISKHVDFTRELLLVVADHFQDGMLKRMN